MPSDTEASRRRRSADGVVWEVLPAWRSRLLASGELDLDLWRRKQRVRVVKDGLHRTVYRIDLTDQAVYLKHYRCRRVSQAVRHLFRASAARREWDKANELARRKIPTIHPVGLGEQVSACLVRDNFFVSEAVPRSHSLDDYAAKVLALLPEGERSRQRRQLCVELAKLTADLHRAGVFHHDFHAGNVLVQRTESAALPALAAGFRLLLIDLPSVAFSRPLNWRRSLASLVMLGTGLLERTSKAERWRFWRAYLLYRNDLSELDVRRMACLIERRCFNRARRILGARDKRALRVNRDFIRFETAEVVAHAVSDLPRDALCQLAAEPDEPLRRFVGRPVKLSRRGVVVEARWPAVRGIARVAYKRYRPKNLWKACLDRFRQSPARAGWYVGHALLSRGIATARPIALVEPRRGPQRSYLVTEWIEGGLNLHLYLWQLAEQSPPVRRRRVRHVAESLGRLIGRMHRWRISHRDLKACNLMLVEQPDAVESLLVDVGGVRFRRRISKRRRARNLARLAVSLELHPWLTRGDRLRFLRAYLKAGGRPAGEWKALWRRIAVQALRHTSRMRRRGRPVA